MSEIEQALTMVENGTPRVFGRQKHLLEHVAADVPASSRVYEVGEDLARAIIVWCTFMSGNSGMVGSKFAGMAADVANSHISCKTAELHDELAQLAREERIAAIASSALSNWGDPAD